MLIYTLRQQQIMTTAIELIAEQGIQHLTMKNIAQCLEISEPAIYRHFTNKTGMLMATVKQFGQYNQEIFEQLATKSGDIPAMLKNIFCGHAEMFDRHPALAAVTFSEEIFQNEKKVTAQVLAMKQANEKKILKIIRQGQDQGTVRADLPAEHLMILIMGPMRLLVRKWRLAKCGFDIKKSAQALWQSLAVVLKNKEDAI
ncbi:TetR/AcrR family transcriptional regulator [bacterium]|nr:TetR/AcrR family transcriptional regulator [bacterium]